MRTHAAICPARSRSSLARPGSLRTTRWSRRLRSKPGSAFGATGSRGTSDSSSTTTAAVCRPRRRRRWPSSPATHAWRCWRAASAPGKARSRREWSCSTSRGSSSSRASMPFRPESRSRSGSRTRARDRRRQAAGGVPGPGRRPVRPPPGAHPRRAERRGLDAVRVAGHPAVAGRRARSRRPAQRHRDRRVLPLRIALGPRDRGAACGRLQGPQLRRLLARMVPLRRPSARALGVSPRRARRCARQPR